MSICNLNIAFKKKVFLVNFYIKRGKKKLIKSEIFMCIARVYKNNK